MIMLYIIILWIIVSIILLAIWVKGLNEHMIDVLKSDIAIMRDLQKLCDNLDKIEKIHEKKKK